ncbi:unnamed protein product [Porites evermanni]|uniref:Uncharacterized protein n=1 Tax=Porites evermanni TaxID=104178 RepID=A0ABN8SFK1_9CNID|nr:unnamed protein product [Porites evermanni]
MQTLHRYFEDEFERNGKNDNHFINVIDDRSNNNNTNNNINTNNNAHINAVTVCTLFDGEIKQWTPGEKRIDLNGKNITNFTLSNIIGSTVDPRPQDDVLQKNVTVVFRHEEGRIEPHCVFWDFTAK